MRDSRGLQLVQVAEQRPGRADRWTVGTFEPEPVESSHPELPGEILAGHSLVELPPFALRDEYPVERAASRQDLAAARHQQLSRRESSECRIELVVRHDTEPQLPGGDVRCRDR